MRMLLKAEMDTEKGNRAITEGTMPALMEKIMGVLEPEAAYFTAMDGKRTALIFFDLKEPSDIPRSVETLFVELGADISMSPVMNRDDVTKGLQRL